MILSLMYILLLRLFSFVLGSIACNAYTAYCCRCRT